MPSSVGSVAELMRKFNLATTKEPYNAVVTGVIVSGLLESLDIMIQQPSPKWNEEVITPMGDVQNVARAALRNLHFNLSHRKRNIRRLCRISQAVHFITYLSIHQPICDAFVAQHSIQALVTTIGSIFPLPDCRGSLESTILCISSSCICVHRHIFANDGLAGIIEAFSSGIFPVLMRCADLLDVDDEKYFLLLSKDLPKFIIYPSVLRTAKKSLEAFDEELLQKSSKVQSLTSKKAWEAYTRFKESMEGVTLVRDAGIVKGQEVCSNDKCIKSDLRSALRLCSGCRAAYYCSSACQRADWKESHRSQCKETIRMRDEGFGEPISSRDISFVHTFAQNEVFLRSKRIISICREHGNTMPVVELDYAQYPFNITIRSLASMTDILSDEQIRNYRGAFEESATVNTEGIYVVVMVRYPTGQSSRMMGSMVFMKPPGGPDPGFDCILDRYCTLQVQV